MVRVDEIFSSHEFILNSPKRKWNSLLSWGTVWKWCSCYENIQLLINTLDFIIDESVKKQMAWITHTFVKTGKIQWVGSQSVYHCSWSVCYTEGRSNSCKCEREQ